MVDTGVYQIRNLADSKRYIGSAAGCSISKRWGIHRAQLKGNKHINLHLQRAWNRDGENIFVFEIVEQCDPANCIAREQFFIDQHDWDQLYNINPRAASRLGARHSKEAKQKMSRAKTGSISPFRGATHTNESKVKMSHAARGRYTGSKHPNAKLDEQKVRIVKRALRIGVHPAKLAKRFNIGIGTIRHIQKERQWSHVKV